jgi:cell division protein FtsI (penicillin-binding protein 3)
VLEPFSGEVLAMASVDTVPAADGGRLHNPAIQDAFEPGSTMKGLLGAIALDRHVIDVNRRIYCERGAWRFAGKTIHDDGPHGWLNLGEIIEVSSNIGAAKIALSLGADAFAKGLDAFGLGAKTGIDLPGEATGLMRAPAKWRPIELADHGFGQGIAVTPIQLASAYAAIANGGVVMRPYLVKAAYDANGREIFEHTPQVLRRAIAPATAHTINNLLRGVVNSPDGTGRLAQVTDFTVAGKTGTAQMVNPATGAYYQNRLVASFVGFIPAQDPKLVILVVLYDVPHGHFGGLYAAPVFSEIASNALNHLDVAPQHPAYDTASLIPSFASSDSASTQESSAIPGEVSPAITGSSLSVPYGTIPDFTGLSLRSALALARAYGLNPKVSGTGYVIRQGPRAGARNRGVLRLELASVTGATPIDNHSTSNRSRPLHSPILVAREVRRARNIQ